MIVTIVLPIILFITLSAVISYIRFETSVRYHRMLLRSAIRQQVRQQALAGALTGLAATFAFYRPGQNQTLLLAFLFVPIGLLIYLNATRRRIAALKEEFPTSEYSDR